MAQWGCLYRFQKAFDICRVPCNLSEIWTSRNDAYVVEVLEKFSTRAYIHKRPGTYFGTFSLKAWGFIRFQIPSDFLGSCLVKRGRKLFVVFIFRFLFFLGILRSNNFRPCYFNFGNLVISQVLEENIEGLLGRAWAKRRLTARQITPRRGQYHLLDAWK